MAADATHVIVTQTAAGSAQVHHREFPEIRAEAASSAVAADHLIHQLSRALDTALTNWRREAIQQAIADVEAFKKA